MRKFDMAGTQRLATLQRGTDARPEPGDPREELNRQQALLHQAFTGEL